MNKCNICNVKVYESEKVCPLCKSKLHHSTVSHTTVEYPEYKNVTRKKSMVNKIGIFIVFVVVIITGYINFFTHDEGDIIWSIIVISSICYSYYMVRVIKSTSKKYSEKIILSYIALCMLLFAIDCTTGFNHWSTNYVFPFTTVAITGFLTFLAVRKRKYFSEYFGCILVVLLISTLPIPIYFLGFSDNPWAMFVAVIFSLIIAVGLYLFSDQELKLEIKKRFHR